jgi:molecular chaperone DnaK
MSVVGIDLGTTNTVVACMRDGRVQVIADEHGNRLLPSVVSFHPNGDVLVGEVAKARRLVDAPNTIASVKRLIGRPWDSDEIRLARSRFAFELREGPGQGALVVARGEAYTLPEVSAFVLKRARQIAEAALGEVVDTAVITVPAYFNELQRASTKVAGRVAGLDVLRILNEPTAAALAHGFGGGKSERVAVYDFGGGTFDCSLLDLTGSVFEVLATAGDTFLGGDDIDAAIAEAMCNAFLAEHRYDPRVDVRAFERVRAAAEQLKKDLSFNMQAEVDLPDISYGISGRKLGMVFRMSRPELDALAAPYVERTLQVTQDALQVAGLSPASFDQVILVGGSTRMPLVKRRVETYFGIPVMDGINPEEVVAIGAAVQAAALVDASRRQSIPPPPKPGVIGPPLEAASPAPAEGRVNSNPPREQVSSSTLGEPPEFWSGWDDEAETLSTEGVSRTVPDGASGLLPAERLGGLADTDATPPRSLTPILVDVTPRALVVETVGGFCDTVIPRNATIPCEHTRVFATGRDLQTVVHVRVAQGEAQYFKDNTCLGELELSGLRPAPRGDVTMSVTFELDADGSLQVHAVDTASGRDARAVMKLVAVAQTEEEIERMIARGRSMAVTG